MLISTKKERYVRRINCLSYKELIQSLKVKYFLAFEQNVARSCELCPFFLVFLWKSYSATLIMRWYDCGLQGNLDRKQGNWPENILRAKLYSRRGLVSLEVQNVWTSCVYETLERDSPCLNRCLLDFTTRKLRENVSRFVCMDESHG